ncbi:MAG TPA: hypothetical protein VLN90_00870 [Thioalkalivibrio sp.]|nr:hypothetical protein [Thioalkalivibrio sp.]
MLTRKNTWTAVIATTLLCVAATASAMDTHTRNAELLSVASVDTGMQAIHTDPGQVSDRRILTPGLDRTAFEQELSDRFLGTHMLYSKLTDDAKEAVYAYYQDDNQIEGVRRKVAYSL